MTDSKLHTELKSRQLALIKQKQQKMLVTKNKIASWQKKVAKRFASQLGAKPDRIKIYPWNSKRDLTCAHRCLGSVVCPVNQRMYFAYWDLR